VPAQKDVNEKEFHFKMAEKRKKARSWFKSLVSHSGPGTSAIKPRVRLLEDTKESETFSTITPSIDWWMFEEEKASNT
jgi:hypothetical protein